VTKIRLYIVGGIMGEMSMEYEYWQNNTDGKTKTLEKKLLPIWCFCYKFYNTLMLSNRYLRDKKLRMTAWTIIYSQNYFLKIRVF
jgi:hypothetical protein